MSALTVEVQALDRLLDPVRDCLTADAAARIVALRADPETQAHLDMLAEKNAEGSLNAEQEAVYEAYVHAGNLITILQAKARSVLENPPIR